MTELGWRYGFDRTAGISVSTRATLAGFELSPFRMRFKPRIAPFAQLAVVPSGRAWKSF